MSDIEIHEDPLPLGPMTKKVKLLIQQGAPMLSFKTRAMIVLADELFQQCLAGQFPLEIACWTAKPECEALSIHFNETVWGLLDGVPVMIKDSEIIL